MTTSTEPTATATPAAAATLAPGEAATPTLAAATAGTRPRRRGSPLQIGLALFALAMGGFAIGTTEFVSMGLLPQLASGVGVSHPDGRARDLGVRRRRGRRRARSSRSSVPGSRVGSC